MSQQLKFHFSCKSNLKNLGRILSLKEKFALYLAIIIFLGSLVFWGFSYYLSATKEIPAWGGEYTEGTIGQPMYVNPILASSNEVDSALSQLIFSSLMKYDQQGKLKPDLAEKYEISQDGTVYTFFLNKKALWHDKKPVSAQDVLFTVNLIKDPNYKSPLRGDWQEIEPILINDETISFKLPKPYTPFLNKTTFGILPKHIFESISADKFLLAQFNLKPIGSGPFIFSSFQQNEQNNITSYQLLANPDYYQDKPYLEKINFNFYADEDALISAYTKKEINGFSIFSYSKIKTFLARKDTKVHSMKTPRYFAVFFNQTKSKALADRNVREALSFATNRQNIIDEVFSGYAQPVFSPILSKFGLFESSNEIDKREFSLQKAQEILENAGWKVTGDGFREKNGEKLEISIITTQWPDLAKTAEILTNQWQAIGVKVNITTLTISDIQQNYIRPREYQSILFGEEYFGNDPDLYNFWSSAGKKDQGSNIALYDNSKVDKLLEDARAEQDLEKRKALYADFEKQINNDIPAVFLYSPDHVYIVNKKIKGVQTSEITNSAHRFDNTNLWYQQTKRIKKDN